MGLANTAAPDKPLPDYVAVAGGLSPAILIDVPRGTMVTSVRLLATKDATLVSAIINGHDTPVFRGTERGHPMFEVQVVVPPGQSGEVTFRLSEPTSAGAPRVPIQPLIDTVIPEVTVPACGPQRDARLTAETTARSDAVVIDVAMPTPHTVLPPTDAST